MTPALEFLACELGKVTLEACPTDGGFSVRLESRGIDRRAGAPTLAVAVATAATEALEDYRARHMAALWHASATVEAERETIAAIDELLEKEAERCLSP